MTKPKTISLLALQPVSLSKTALQNFKKDLPAFTPLPANGFSIFQQPPVFSKKDLWMFFWCPCMGYLVAVRDYLGQRGCIYEAFVMKMFPKNGNIKQVHCRILMDGCMMQMDHDYTTFISSTNLMTYSLIVRDLESIIDYQHGSRVDPLPRGEFFEKIHDALDSIVVAGQF